MVQYTQAKAVGGGSIVNGMAFDRGAPADYEAWMSLGNPGWGWDDLLPYFKRVAWWIVPVPMRYLADYDVERDIYAGGNRTSP